VQRHPLSRASDVGPQARNVAPHAPAGAFASRRSTAGFMASGPTRHSKTTRLRTPCELLASARSGGGWVSIASRVLLARQRAGHRIPSYSCNASREHPRRTERHDDTARQGAVNVCRSYAKANCRHPVDARSALDGVAQRKPNAIRATRINRKVLLPKLPRGLCQPLWIVSTHATVSGFSTPAGVGGEFEPLAPAHARLAAHQMGPRDAGGRQPLWACNVNIACSALGSAVGLRVWEAILQVTADATYLGRDRSQQES
jgi:hypothetical protein